MPGHFSNRAKWAKVLDRTRSAVTHPVSFSALTQLILSRCDNWVGETRNCLSRKPKSPSALQPIAEIFNASEWPIRGDWVLVNGRWRVIEQLPWWAMSAAACWFRGRLLQPGCLKTTLMFRLIKSRSKPRYSGFIELCVHCLSCRWLMQMRLIERKCWCGLH